MTNLLAPRAVPLFGGAIAVDIPTTFQDVSTIRQVPDTQEVYLDSQGFTSVIFDLLERVERPTDVEALHFHLSDIVGEEDAREAKVWTTADAHLTKMPSVRCVTLLATAPAGEKMRGRENEPEFVGIILVLCRLEAQGTDFVVAVNVPHVAGEYVREEVKPEAGKLGSLLERGIEIRSRILETLEVRDWSLFVDE